jgi:thiol-disulfide isomerase/thioredoxin
MNPRALIVAGAIVLSLTAAAAAPVLAAGGGLQPGAPFPHFSHKDITGKDIDTKKFAEGKALYLDFWSIYCTSCLQEMPHLIKVYEKYKDKGLAALSIDMDAFGVKRVMKFIDGLDFKIPYPTIIDDKREIGTLLGVNMLPTVILVDPQGKVKIFHVGYKPGWENEFEKLVLEVLPKK